VSKLYLTSTAGPVGYVDTEKSTALPVGTQYNATVTSRMSLGLTPSGSQVQRAATVSAVQQDDDIYFGKWISAALGVTAIDANTWDWAFAWTESNAALNLFTVISIYVLTSGDTVRGFIYDSHASLGTEPGTSEIGKTGTFAGSAVAGVVATDRLCIEVWAHTQKTMSVAYTGTFSYAGGTDPTDGTATSDAASYINTPQELWPVAFQPRPTATDFRDPAVFAVARRPKLWRPRLWLPEPAGVPA
jgi:hypothetical protein